MTRLLTCGFEIGSYDEMNGTKGIIVPIVDAAYARTGNYGCALRSSSSYLGHAFDANKSELYFRVAARWSSTGIAENADFLVFRDADSTEHFTIYYNSGTQALDIRRGGVTLSAGANALSALRWYVIEGRVVIDNTTGSVTIKVNGVTHVSYTGDTAGSATESVRSILFGPVATTVIDTYIHLDDIAFNDTEGSYQNSWIGLGGIYLLKPSGEGATQNFTPSAGTVHYSLVDDVPANTTDWVQGDTSGQIELYEVDDTPTYITTVDLVEVIGQAAVVESGSNILRGIMRQGTVNYSGTISTTVVSVADSYAVVKSEPFYVQPSTSTAWGTADVNALQAGWEIPS